MIVNIENIPENNCMFPVVHIYSNTVLLFVISNNLLYIVKTKTKQYPVNYSNTLF